MRACTIVHGMVKGAYAEVFCSVKCLKQDDATALGSEGVAKGGCCNVSEL